MKRVVHEQKDAYRRGLVLGFTMAEITIMVLFCLLLASSLIIKRISEKDERARAELAAEGEAAKLELAAARKELNSLVEVRRAVSALKERAGGPKDIDDLFVELRLAAQDAVELRELRKAKSDFESAQVKLDAIAKAVPRADGSVNTVEAALDSLRESYQFEHELRNGLLGSGIENSSVADIASTARAGLDRGATVQQCELNRVEAERLRGQLRNAQVMLERVGRGTEMPACWADPRTGRPEYIFVVELTSKGLLIHDQKLPHRAADQALLPLSAIRYGEELVPDDFLSQTDPLFQWSVAHECRFFVIARDRTLTGEKDVYKTMLRTLEQNFYKFLSD